MPKLYDPKKKERRIRNIIGITGIWSFVLVALFYSAFCLMFLAINGLAGLKQLFSLAPDIHLVTVYETITAYGTWWYQNRMQIGFFGVNFFAIKFFGPFVLFYGILLCVVVIFWDRIKRFRIAKKEPSLYGDAHWAEEWELKPANLRDKMGFMLGKDKKGVYYVSGGYQHKLVAAPTGSGKGVGIILPTLLFWTGSCVCHDIKKENYELTSGWRSSIGQPVYIWEPANSKGQTHCFNPMDFVATEPGKRVDDVQQLANLLLKKHEFWENEARTFFCSLVLILFSMEDKVKSFGEVLRLMRSDDFAYNMAVILDTKGAEIHPAGYMGMSAFLSKPDKERSGVASTLSSAMELWINPYIDLATETSDFDLRTFRTKPNTVYVALTPENIQRLQCLMAMFYIFVISLTTSRLPTKTEKTGIYLVVDEMPTLGKMEILLGCLAYARAYLMALMSIVQDLMQLKGAYEDHGMQSIVANSRHRVFYASNNAEQAKTISEFCGNQTVEAESYTKKSPLGGLFGGGGGGGGGQSISAMQSPLIKPQDVLSLPPNREIILVEAAPPTLGYKIKYYEDKTFTKRLLKPTDIPIKPLPVRTSPVRPPDDITGDALVEPPPPSETIEVYEKTGDYDDQPSAYLPTPSGSGYEQEASEYDNVLEEEDYETATADAQSSNDQVG